jgi:hypothetical protein
MRLLPSDGPLKTWMLSQYYKDGLVRLNNLEEPTMRTWLSNPSRSIDAGFTSWAGMTPYKTWDFGFGLPTALRPPLSAIPYVVVLPMKHQSNGDDSIDVVVAVSGKVHNSLAKDPEFQRFVADYFLEQ